MEAMKKAEGTRYDYTSLDDFFRYNMTATQLADCIVQVAFNYATNVDEDCVKSFKDDIGVLQCLYEEVMCLAIKAKQTDISR